MDYCGPAGDGRIAKLMSKWIPDYIQGVYIGDPCCKDHDNDNTDNGANKSGDENLEDCIECELRKAGLPEWQIWYYKKKYYIGVRIGNPFYKSSSELLGDIKIELKRKVDAITKAANNLFKR